MTEKEILQGITSGYICKEIILADILMLLHAKKEDTTKARLLDMIGYPDDLEVIDRNIVKMTYSNGKVFIYEFDNSLNVDIKREMA